MAEEEARRRDARGGTGHAAACQTDVAVRDEQLRCVVMLRPAEGSPLQRGKQGGQGGHGQGGGGNIKGLQEAEVWVEGGGGLGGMHSEARGTAGDGRLIGGETGTRIAIMQHQFWGDVTHEYLKLVYRRQHRTACIAYVACTTGRRHQRRRSYGAACQTRRGSCKVAAARQRQRRWANRNWRRSVNA